MKKTGKVILGVILCLVLTACGEVKEDARVSQNETQTTGHIRGSALDAVTSDEIKMEKYLPVLCQEKEEEYEKILTSGKYTWKNPYIIRDPYGNSPLTAYILFQTQKPCKIMVRVKGKKAENDISGNVETSKMHRVPVVGLYPGMKNKVKITCIYKNGEKKTKNITIETQKLPDDLNDAVRVEERSGKSAYGLTILSGQTTPYPFAYDQNGDIRWYITMTTGSYGVFPLANKRFIYQTNEAQTPTEEKPHTTKMYEMDYLGRAYQVYYVKNGIHHEVIEKTPGGNLFILSSSIDGHTEDVVQELDRMTGEVVKSLDLREIFDNTYVNKVDWAHLNTVSYQKKDNSILISPRNLHSAVKVDWKTKEIRWILTNPKMFEDTEQKDKVLKPIGDITWHFQQHSVYEIPYDLDGNPETIHVMLYDNHWQTKRKVPFFDKKKQSYVSVYAIDEKKMTVRQEKLFPGVRSVITSNCAYEKKMNRIFSFGGYLHPFIHGQKGMIYEFDYLTGEIKNQYSTKYYFYRGYEMQINWEDLAKPLNIGEDYVKGTLQAPVRSQEREIPTQKVDEKQVDFYLRETVLYMKTSDHAIDKVRFVGKSYCYVMDYSSAGKGMKSKKNQTYAIAIPLTEMKKDTYQIVVKRGGQWYDTQKHFEINKEEKP